MVKKVFKIIGIVMGCVAGFVGAVVGVMAAQGKFKKVVVYPEVLEFAANEQTIVAYEDEDDQYAYMKTDNGKDYLYSFVLNGTASSEYEVNRKTCYVSFDNGQGSNLIELWDKNKDLPIAKESGSNRYKIECNEQVYYKVKNSRKEDNDITEAGKVVLTARSENNMVVSSNKLTISIDRAVRNISLTSGSIAGTTQRVEVGKDVERSFSFKSTPSLALSPIPGVGGKNVEIYYKDPNRDDLVRVHKDMVSSYDFLHYTLEKGVFFRSSEIKTYQFVLAVFDTYKAEEEYNAVHSDPNVVVTNLERVRSMITTDLELTVVNSNVDEIRMQPTGGVNLNLYLDNNYLIVGDDNGDSPDVNNNNYLGIEMFREKEELTLRLNEIQFGLNDMRADNIVFTSSSNKNKKIEFINTNTAKLTGFGLDNNDVKYELSNGKIQFTTDNTTSLNIKFTGSNNDYLLNLGKPEGNNKHNLLSIASLELVSGNLESETFICSNGLAFYDETTTTVSGTGAEESTTYSLKLLTSGSYLEFYTNEYVKTTDTEVVNGKTYYSYNDDKYTAVSTPNSENLTSYYEERLALAKDFSYEIVSKEGEGKDRKFNIIAKSQCENLFLGLLVVNSDGGEMLFTNANVTVEEQQFNHEFTNNGNHTLNIEYTQDTNNEGYAISRDELPVMNGNNRIVTTSGSFNQVVFVTEKQIAQEGEDPKYNIDVLEKITYSTTDDGVKTYVLVGYLNDKNEFVNNVRVRDGASGDTKIYMVQLETSFGETAETYITNLIENKNPTSLDPIKLQLKGGNPTPENPVALQTESGDNAPTDPKIVTVKNVYINDNDAVTISVNYVVNESVKNLMTFGVSEDNENIKKDSDNSVYNVKANSNSIKLTLTCNIPNFFTNLKSNMPENEFNNTIKFMVNSNISDRVSNVNLEVNETEVSTFSTLNITFDAGEPLLNSDDTIYVHFEYGDCVVDSNAMVDANNNLSMKILSTAPSEIYLQYGDNTINLTNATVNLEVKYTNKFEYEYTINGNPIDLTLNNAYTENSSSVDVLAEEGGEENATPTASFVIVSEAGKKGFEVSHTLSYTGNNVPISENKIDNASIQYVKGYSYFISITSGSTTRNLNINIAATEDNNNAKGFKLETYPLNEINGVSVDLTSSISYAYDTTQIPLTNVKIKSVELTAFSLGTANYEVIKESGTFKVVEKTKEVEHAGESTRDVASEVENPASVSSILEVSQDASGKITISRKSNLNTNIEIRLTLGTSMTEDKTINVSFTSSITISTNSNWDTIETLSGVKVYKIYKDTKVKLYDYSTTDSLADSKALFRITNSNKADTSTVEVTLDSETILQTYKFTTTGEYSVTFALKKDEVSTEIGKFTIRVVDNVVAIAKTGDKTLYGGDNVAITDLFDLYQYNTQHTPEGKTEKEDIVFGDSYLYEDIYDSTKINNISTQIADMTNLSLSSNNKDTKLGFNENTKKWKINWIEDLEYSFNETFTLSCNGVALESKEVTIANKYKHTLDKGENAVYKYMVKTQYTPFVSINSTDKLNNAVSSFTLTAVEFMMSDGSIWTSEEVTVASEDKNKEKCIDIKNVPPDDVTSVVFVINKFIGVNYTPKTVTFKFSDGTNTLTYVYDNENVSKEKQKVVITPYVPAHINSFLSGNDIDLYGDIFTNLSSEIKSDKNLNGLFTNVKLVSDPSSFSNLNSAQIKEYFSSGTTNALTCKINEITEDHETLTLTYMFTYIDGTSANVEIPFTIHNRQSITADYPFNDIVISENETTIEFLYEDTNTTKDITISVNTGFEPVLTGQTISFGYNANSKINRTIVYNRSISGNAISDDRSSRLDAIKEVKILAYQNKSTLKSYISNNPITIEGGIVTFGKVTGLTSGNMGYVILRVYTVSGNYCDYYVMIYNNANEANQFSGVDNDNEFVISSEVPPETAEPAAESTEQTETTLKDIINLSKLKPAVSKFTNKKIPENSVKVDDYRFYLLTSSEVIPSSCLIGDCVNNANINAVSTYHTIYLALMYKTDFETVYLGNIKLNLRPNVTVTVDESVKPVDKVVNESSESKVSDIGEYTREIAYNEFTFNVPFSVTKDSNKVDLSSISFTLDGREYSWTPSTTDGAEGGTDPVETPIVPSEDLVEENIPMSVVEDNTEKDLFTFDTNGNLKINKIVTEDKTFTIVYTYASDLILKVKCTLKKTTINTDNTNIDVGEFNETTTTFDNKLKLADYVGNYARNIGISTGTGSGTLTSGSIPLTKQQSEISTTNRASTTGITVYTTGEYQAPSADLEIQYIKESTSNTDGASETYYAYLVFKQKTSDYNKIFTITYSNVDVAGGVSAPQRTITARVKKGIYIKTSTGKDSGYDKSTAKPTTLNNTDEANNLHNRADASYLDVTVNSGLNIFTIGGTTIYTSEASILEISYDKPNYVLNAGKTEVLTDTNNKTEIKNTSTKASSDPEKIYFAHTSQVNNVIMLSIKIKTNGNTYYKQNADTDLTQSFFVKVTQSYAGIEAVYKVNGADHENILETASPTNLYEKIYSQISNNTSTYIANEEYHKYRKYRIAIKSTKKDSEGKNILIEDYNPVAMGFTNSITCTGDTNNPNNTNNPNYITFTSSSAMISSDGKATFTAYDGEDTLCPIILSNGDTASTIYNFQVMAKGATVTDGITFDIDANGVTGTEDNTMPYVALTSNKGDEIKDKRIATFIDHRYSPFYITAKSIYLNGSDTALTKDVTCDRDVKDDTITYTITFKNSSDSTKSYTLTFTYQLLNGEYALVASVSDFSDLTSIRVNMTIHGSTESTTFDLMLFNANVSSKYNSETNREGLNGGTEGIDMLGKDKYGNNRINVSYTSNLAVELTKVEAMIDGDHFESTSKTNRLFTMTNNVMNLEPVGVDVPAKLTFNVTYNGYIIGVVDYYILIVPNFEILINGQGLPTGNKEFVTNYQLTTGMLSTSSSSFLHEDKLTADKDSDTENNITDEKVTDLVLSLKSGGQVINSSYLQFEFDETEEEKFKDIIKDLNQATLNFIEDYTGEINLKILVATGNGTYEVGWRLNVTGLATFSYMSSTNLYPVNPNETANAGSNVTLISPNNTEGVKFDTVLDINGNNNNVFKISGQYVLYAQTEDFYVGDFNAQTEFGKFDDTDKKNLNTLGSLQFNSDKELEIRHPYVPMSNTTYIVIYEVNITYCKHTEILYLAYRIKNKQSIVTNTDMTTINVDTLTGNKLPLFNVSQTFTATDGTVYTLKLDKIAIRGQDNKFEFIVNAYDNSNISQGQATEVYIGEETKEGSLSQSITNAEGVLFKANYSSIFELVELLNNVTGVDITDASGGGLTGYTLECADHVLYIDLAEKVTESVKLFTNTLTANVKLIADSQPVVESHDIIFRGNTTLSAVNTSYTLRSMFLNSYLSGVDEKYKDIPLAGLGTPSGNWINIETTTGDTTSKNLATISEEPRGTEIGKIKVPKGIDNDTKKTQYNTYTLKKFTYTYSTDSSVYSCSQDFYYIAEEPVYVVNYAIGLSSWKFKATDDENSQSFNFTDMVKKYSMKENIITESDPESEDNKHITPDIKKENNNNVIVYYIDNTKCTDSNFVTVSGNKLSISKTNLSAYKESHPNEETLLIQFIATFPNNNTENLLFSVEFDLTNT